MEPIDLRAAALGPKGYKINPIKSSRKRRLGDDIAAGTAAAEAQAELMEHDGAAAEQPPAPKRQRVEGEPWRTVSGKVWKAAGVKAGTYKSQIVGSSWDKKMATKAAKKQFSAQKSEAVQGLRAKRKVRMFAPYVHVCSAARASGPESVAHAEQQHQTFPTLNQSHTHMTLRNPLPLPPRTRTQAKSDERAAAKERKKTNQAKSAVVHKITNSATVKKMMKSRKQRKLLKTADTN